MLQAIRTNMKNQNNHKKAYSLTELSIVILILSILLSGSLTAFNKYDNNAKIKITQYRLKEVYKSMGAFLMSNGMLPCPASIIDSKIANSTYGVQVGSGANCVGTGVYQSTTATNLVYGMIPVSTLKLPSEMAEDGFGNKFTYIIDKRFATSASSFDTTSPTGIITVKSKQPNAVDQTINTNIIFVIISHGANKYGSFAAKSTSQATRSSDSEELENDATTFDNSAKTAVFDNNIYYSSDSSDVFDDIIFFKARAPIIFDFDIASLIHCQGYSETLYGTTITWPSAEFGQTVLASTACPNSATYNYGSKYPSRKCGFGGSWLGIVHNCLGSQP